LDRRAVWTIPRRMQTLPYAFAAALVLVPVAASAAEPSIETLVVTASRRDALLNTTAANISYIGAELAADVGVQDVRDLAKLTPGLLGAATSNPTYMTLRVRGVGTVGDNPGLESSVAVVVDGVRRARNGASLSDLGDLDHIEVLKGPQAALFGKSVTAGLINVTTASPTFTPSASGEIDLGNFGARAGRITLNGPLVADQLAGRLYVSARQRDGFYDIRTGEGPRTETDDSDQNSLTVRGQLLWTPTEAISLRVIADSFRQDESCCVGVTIRTGPSTAWVDSLASDAGVLTPADPARRLVYWNRNTHARIDESGLSGQLTWRGDGLTLNSITALRDWDAALGQDWDFTSADVAYRPDDGGFAARFSTLSEEVTLAGKSGPLDWLVGGYIGEERLRRRDALLYGTDYEAYLGLVLTGGVNPNRVSELTGLPTGQSYVAGQGERDEYRQVARTTAIFTDQTLKLSDLFDLNYGLRLTNDDKTVRAAFANTDGGKACAAALARGAASTGTLCLPWSNPAFNGYSSRQSSKDSNVSGHIKLIARPSEDLTLWAGYATGYKAAGFNLDRAQTSLVPDASTAFASEDVRNIELGARRSLLGDRLLVSVTAFDAKFTDFQLNTFLGTTFVVRSVPKVTSRGVDADFRWSDGPLSLQGGAVYADTRYGKDALPGLALLPGARLSFAPLWSASLAGGYDVTAGSWLTRLSLSAKYSSDYNTGSDLAPAKVQTAFVLLGGRVSLGPADRRWSVDLWGENLTDELYYQVAYNAPFQGSTGIRDTPAPIYDPARDTQTYGAFLGAPRTYGVTFRMRR